MARRDDDTVTPESRGLAKSLQALNTERTTMPYIGSRVKRKEDVRLLRGIGKYVGDIHRAGMVHAAILRSTHAHARIVKIDAAAALKLPGVVGVLTAADMPGAENYSDAHRSYSRLGALAANSDCDDESALRRRSGRRGRRGESLHRRGRARIDRS